MRELDIKKHFEIANPKQDILGAIWLRGIVKSLSPKVYVEIGCEELGAFGLFESLLPAAPEGLAIGIDISVRDGWEEYKSFSGCTVELILGDSTAGKTVNAVRKALGEKKGRFSFY